MALFGQAQSIGQASAPSFYPQLQFSGGNSTNDFDANNFYELNWLTRNRIVRVFTSHSELLYGMKMSKDARDQLISENNRLIALLKDLPLKLAFGSNTPTPLRFNTPTSFSTGFQATNDDKLVVDISGQTRKRIIENLLKNHNSTIFDNISPGDKSSLIQENKYLAQLLVLLDARVVKKNFADREEERMDALKACDFDKSQNETKLKEMIQQQIVSTFRDTNDPTLFAQFLKRLRSQTCTFTITGRNYVEQVSYICKTCNLVDTLGVCYACSQVCHKGHQLMLKNAVNNFCDCGATNPQCKTLIKL